MRKAWQPTAVSKAWIPAVSAWSVSADLLAGIFLFGPGLFPLTCHCGVWAGQAGQAGFIARRPQRSSASARPAPRADRAAIRASLATEVVTIYPGSSRRLVCEVVVPPIAAGLHAVERGGETWRRKLERRGLQKALSALQQPCGTFCRQMPPPVAAAPAGLDWPGRNAGALEHHSRIYSPWHGDPADMAHLDKYMIRAKCLPVRVMLPMYLIPQPFY